MKHIAALVVVVLALWSFAPARTKPVEVPSSPVSSALSKATATDKQRVHQFYAAVADVVERDKKLVATVGQFRRVHANSLEAAFMGTDLPGKYVGLDAAIEAELVQAIGKDDVALTPEKRQALVTALKGVASAAR